MDNEIKEKIDNILSEHDIVLFIKGTPQFPQCGFSGKIVSILKANGITHNKFYSVNILEDDVMRSAIKEYSNWPTIPQLYIKKEFIGGVDIAWEMHESGELNKLLND